MIEMEPGQLNIEAVANRLKSDEYEHPAPVDWRLYRENVDEEEELLVCLPDGKRTSLPFAE